VGNEDLFDHISNLLIDKNEEISELTLSGGGFLFEFFEEKIE
jgi:hypothetical protein